jgi:hypothetical protein
MYRGNSVEDTLAIPVITETHKLIRYSSWPHLLSRFWIIRCTQQAILIMRMSFFMPEKDFVKK